MRIRIAIVAALLGSGIGLWSSSTYAAEPQPIKTQHGLSVFLDKVVVTHPEVLAASKAVRAAEFRARGASRPVYNPAATLSGETAEENTYTAGLELPIDLWGKRAARSSVGEQRLLAAEARLELIRQQVANELLAALTVYQANRDQAQVAQNAEQKLREFSAIAQRRYAAGDIGQVDLDLARLAHAEAIKLSADAAASLQEAQANLALIARQRHAQWPDLPKALPDPGSTTLTSTHLVSTLPQVKLAWLEMQTAEADIAVARKEAKADPTIGVEAGREGEENLIGLSLSIPLFVRNPMTDEIDAAQADAEAASVSAADIADQAGLRVEAAQRRYLMNYDAWQRWSEAAGDALDRGLDRLNRLLESGDIDAGFYLLQLQQRLDAKSAGAELKGNAWQAWGDWLAATAQFQQWLDGTLPAAHFTEMK